MSSAAPRRHAAQKSSALFAEQLGSSDSEGEGPSTPILKRRASTKVTYSKKDRKRPRSASMREVGSKRPHSDISSLSDGGNGHEVSALPRLQGRDLPAADGVKISKATSKPRPRPVPRKPAPVKPPTPPTQIHDDESDLSDLSSSGSTILPGPHAKEEVEPPAADKKPAKQMIPKALDVARSSTTDSVSFPSRSHVSWSLEHLGNYVWVLIEHKSGRAYDADKDDEDGKERIWWPGKVTSPKITDVPLKIKLFGQGIKPTKINKPCEKNVLSRYVGLRKARFICPSFVTHISISSDDVTVSPRKKQRLDRSQIENQWTNAVQMMDVDCLKQDSDDDVPSLAQAFLSTPNGKNDVSISAPPTIHHNSNGKAKGVTTSQKRSTNGKKKVEPDAFWEPPEAEDDLDIPGELILAKTHEATQTYWPAKIMNYVPPTKPGKAPKYTILFLDGKEKSIQRGWFYTMQEPRFRLCNMGEFESSYVEIQNDDDGEEDRQRQLVKDDARQCASPVPADPLPSPEEFSRLSIREQFVYTKLVLKAILDDEYGPARERREQFMAGGRQRKSVVADAGLRGTMAPEDVDALHEYILQWCLRGEVERRAVGVDEVAEVLNEVSELTAVQNDDVMDMDAESTRDRLPSPVPTQPPSSQDIPPPSSTISIADNEDNLSTAEGPAPTSAPPTPSQRSVTSITETEPHGDDMMMPPGQIDDLSEEPPAISRPPKQTGCPAFEALPLLTKADYCLNIMLPEAVRQTLLWRTGKRRSLELLTPEQELDLHRQGTALLNESDWVTDIVRYRNLSSRKQSRNKKQGTGSATASNRPRRNIDIPNYQE